MHTGAAHCAGGSQTLPLGAIGEGRVSIRSLALSCQSSVFVGNILWTTEGRGGQLTLLGILCACDGAFSSQSCSSVVHNTHVSKM